MGVEGRWRINEMRMGLGWNASMGGPVTDSLPVWVVPCDDAAVERVSYALCTLPPEWLYALVNGDTDRDYSRLIAEAVLKAAAGQETS